MQIRADRANGIIRLGYVRSQNNPVDIGTKGTFTKDRFWTLQRAVMQGQVNLEPEMWY